MLVSMRTLECSNQDSEIDAKEWTWQRGDCLPWDPLWPFIYKWWLRCHAKKEKLGGYSLLYHMEYSCYFLAYQVRYSIEWLLLTLWGGIFLLFLILSGKIFNRVGQPHLRYLPFWYRSRYILFHNNFLPLLSPSWIITWIKRVVITM